MFTSYCLLRRLPLLWFLCIFLGTFDLLKHHKHKDILKKLFKRYMWPNLPFDCSLNVLIKLIVRIHVLRWVDHCLFIELPLFSIFLLLYSSSLPQCTLAHAHKSIKLSISLQHANVFYDVMLILWLLLTSLSTRCTLFWHTFHRNFHKRVSYLVLINITWYLINLCSFPL